LRVLSRVFRYPVRLAVASLVVAAVGLGVPAPAQAATCSSAKGVSVVVDFHALGGGVQTYCDTGGAGKTADAQLRDAGHRLTYVQRQPGFICRIDGKPANDPCVNTPPSDAYWSLWWSDGKSGKWSYSSQGASSLKVPEGGYVGMSWQGSSSKSPPGISPNPHAAHPSSSPTTHPSTHPSTRPSTHGSSSPSSGPAPAPPPTSGPATTASPSGSTSPGDHAGGQTGQHQSDPAKTGKGPGKASQGPDQTEAGGPVGKVATKATADESDGSSSGGLPGWVAPLAIAVLFVGAGAIALVRRKTSGGG